MATPEGSTDFGYVSAPIRCHSAGHVPITPSKLSPNPNLDAISCSDEFRFDSSLHAMAFADELFRDGKVMPALKLPPRLQHLNPDATPLTSRGRKHSFSSWNAWREDDFDPFAKAMEKVRESGETRRARSLSPTKRNNESKKVMVAEPKGVSIGRRLRLVKMGSEGDVGSRRHKVKEFVFRKKEEKKWDGREGDKEKRVTTEAVVQYRPKLFLCLGYGMKKFIL